MTRLKRSLVVPVRAISGGYPSAVPRSIGSRPLLEGVKNLVIRFHRILAASKCRAIQIVTEMCGQMTTHAWGVAVLRPQLEKKLS